MASVGSRGAASKHARRSIRVIASPAPISFAERRSVLQVLELYGPIEMFKLTNGSHSYFNSLTRDESTARRLIVNSPISYHVSVPRNATDIQIADLVEPSSFRSLEPSVWISPDSGADQIMGTLGGKSPRHFRLSIFPDHDFNHMAVSPLTEVWPTFYKDDKSFIAMTLKQSLPDNIARDGLQHWLLDHGSNVKKSAVQRLQTKKWLPSNMKG